MRIGGERRYARFKRGTKLRHLLPATIIALAAACAPAVPDAGPASNGMPAAAGAANDALVPAKADRLVGRWRIASLNGQPVGSIAADERHSPHLVFSATGYGGNAGCNSFGGLGLFVDGRYQGAPGMQTVMGCGPALNEQERRVTGLLRSSPRVRFAGADRVELASGAGTLALERSTDDLPVPNGIAEPPLLAGTTWTLSMLDGEMLPRPDEGRGARTLRFDADGWTARLGCGTLTGRWRQDGDRIASAAPAARTTPACPPAEASLDARFLRLMDASPRFATGPNGELLIASGEHMLYGERVRDLMRDDSALLAGRWRVVAVDGAAPLDGAGSKAPFVTFGPFGYFGGTGCNGFGGASLAQRGRLYTAPGPQTQALCADFRAQEDRMTALFAAAPRIAAAGPDEIALVDRAGSLRLRRDGARTPTEANGRLWTGALLRARLETLDGHLLQDASAALSFSAGRWEGRVGCQAQGGVWRRRGAAFAFFAERPLEEPECDEPRAARDRRLRRLLNGEARILIGPNGEFLMAGEDGWLTGQVERAR